MSSYYENVSQSEKVNLRENDFYVAFAIEDYYAPRQLKNDPAYTKWLFRIYGKKDGKPYERIISHHICTDEDYDGFYPIEDASTTTLKDIRSDPNRGFYCLDWDESEPLEVYGAEI